MHPVGALDSTQTIWKVGNYLKGNYHLVPNCIFDESFTPYEISVYGYLASCSDKSRMCFPTRENIAKKCEIKSVRTVDKALKNLEELGYINKTFRYNHNGTNTSNIYKLNKMD